MVRSGAVGILRPSAPRRQAVNLSVGRVASGRKDRAGRGAWVVVGWAGRGWIRPPAERIDDAGRRLREAA
jgi:hypothetical protein